VMEDLGAAVAAVEDVITHAGDGGSGGAGHGGNYGVYCGGTPG
jgi:hypothetical protein